MKKFTIAAVMAALAIAGTTHAGNVAMLVASDNVASLNAQERAAAEFFKAQYPNGAFITATNASQINSGQYDVVWVHVDRQGIGQGWDKLPDGFGTQATADALATFIANGGSVYLSKHATQLTYPMGTCEFPCNIFSDGDGGNGTDIWTIQAIIGVVNDAQYFPNPEPGREFDASQVYDHTNHPIYKDLFTVPAHDPFADFETPTYPMEGTGNGTEMWREDHNCMWDLNACAFTTEGPNTTVQFEKQCNATLLGTWGHVQDYCVAGIVEFNPKAEGKGIVLTNGLAACEWAPRNGGNAYGANLDKLTSNAINYLLSVTPSAVEKIEAENADAPKVYYNLQGMQISENNLSAGVYVVRQGTKTYKQIVK